MIERITSKTNPYIKHLKRLRTDRGYRYAQRCYLADGEKLLSEALRWNTPLSAVIVQDGTVLPRLPETVRVITVPETLMRDISRMDTPQGILTVCRMPEPASLCIEKGCLILDCIQDPGNVGTILRTADALDVPVILSDGCADPFGEKTVRATMGVPFRTKIVQAPKEQIIAACRAAGVPIIAAALSDRAEDLRSLPLRDAAVVIGSEGKGVCADYLTAASAEAVIPMSDRCESLNAAVAAAIVMWQMKR